MAKRDEDIGDWIEGEAGGGGLAVVGWGLGSVAAFVLAFASWQYAQPRPAPTETARAESGLPDPSEVTGSIATTDRGQTTVQASRVVGAARVAPLPLAANETVATSRDIEQLRSELREIQRRIVQIGMAGDGMSRRVDRIDERLTTLAAREPSPPPGGEAVRTVEAAPVESPAAKLAERLPTPLPKPALEPAPLAPPTAAFDADGPATTGAVPKTGPASPAAVAALPAIIGQPATPAAERSDPGEAKPSEARVPEARPAETRPADAKTAREPAATRSARTLPTTAPMALRPPVPTPAAPSARPEAPAPRVEAVPALPRPAAAPVAEAPPPVEEARPVPQVRMATATPAAPPPAAAPAPVNASGQAAIDLGGYRTLASLRRSWSDMTIRHGDLSKGLEPLARLRETDSGMEARLLAGPFADQTEAAKACLRLKAAGATCAVTTFSGQPIGGLR